MATSSRKKTASLFADGYDIHAQRRYMSDMLKGNVHPLDPRYGQYCELLAREEQLLERTQRSERRGGAENLISDKEGAAIKKMSGLHTVKDDILHIHTTDAYRLFIGRQRDSAKNIQGIFGARMASAAIKNLWHLSTNNNPFADWALINIDSELDATSKSLAKESHHHKNILRQYKSEGMELTILTSEKTERITLNFSSPYGYALAKLVLDFDYHVRIVKTLQRRDALSDMQANKSINDMRRQIRALFTLVVRFSSNLMNDAVKTHTRADYLPIADADATQRKALLSQAYGDLPNDILLGQLRPRHSMRIKLNEQEVRLLQQQLQQDAATEPHNVPAAAMTAHAVATTHKDVVEH